MSVPHRYALLGGFLVALTASGCSGADSSSRRQLDEMRRDIHSVQSDNDRLNERVTALELAATGGASKKAAGDPDGRPDLQVVHLTPGESPDEFGESVEMPADDAPPTVIRAEGTRVPSVQRGSAPNKQDAEARASAAYEDALDLVERKKYDDALEALSGFLVRYPGHPNADNAMYWRGECYYAMGNYARAAEQFEGLITRFPNGNKVPDALLKLGLAQRRMGEREKATKTFEQLRKSHANSDAASKIPRE